MCVLSCDDIRRRAIAISHCFRQNRENSIFSLFLTPLLSSPLALSCPPRRAAGTASGTRAPVQCPSVSKRQAVAAATGAGGVSVSGGLLVGWLQAAASTQVHEQHPTTPHTGALAHALAIRSHHGCRTPSPAPLPLPAFAALRGPRPYAVRQAQVQPQVHRPPPTEDGHRAVTEEPAR